MNKQFTGKSQRCVLIDGTVREVPVAKIVVKTPFFSGEEEALCMVDPNYDLILGNMQGVRPSNEADNLGNRKVKDTENQKIEEGHAVQTRSHSEESKSFQKLIVLKGLEVSKEEFRDEHRKDKSLSWIRNKVETGEKKKKKKKRHCFWFGVKNELIYRYFKKQRTSLGTD